MFDRVAGRADADTTPIGFVPTSSSIDIRGVDVTPGDMKELLTVHADEWRAEVPLIRKHFAQFGDRLPVELATEIDQLEERLKP